MQKKIFFLSLALGLANATFGQIKTITLQSLYIYSAIKYTQWPNDDQGDFVITVLGDSPMYDELIKISQKKKVGARNIVVRKASAPGEISKSHVLYVGSDKESLLNKISPDASKNATLVITDHQGGLNQGSDLNFAQKGEKITFQISERSLADKKIKISNAFTNLAEK